MSDCKLSHHDDLDCYPSICSLADLVGIPTEVAEIIGSYIEYVTTIIAHLLQTKQIMYHPARLHPGFNDQYANVMSVFKQWSPKAKFEKSLDGDYHFCDDEKLIKRRQKYQPSDESSLSKKIKRYKVVNIPILPEVVYTQQIGYSDYDIKLMVDMRKFLTSCIAYINSMPIEMLSYHEKTVCIWLMTFYDFDRLDI
jgi:hypothetical protein